MRAETRKFAGIATMLCGSMVTFGAHAFEQGAPDIASGPVEPLAAGDVANEAVINEAQYAVDVSPVAASTSEESDMVAQDDNVRHQEVRDVTAVTHDIGQEADARVEPLPVSYAAPIAVPVRKASSVETPREQLHKASARTPSLQHEPVTSDATPTPPPVSPVHAEPLAHEQEIVKPPVSYARHIAVPQAARNDMPPGGNREVTTRVDAEDPNWSSKTTVALSEEKLDTMRGGFEVADGLKISFGISRIAVVNGSLVTQTSFNIPDLSNMTTQQAQALAAANMGSLLQNGAGNVAQQGSVQGLSGAVIQNTLSNQNIQTLTTLNATVNSLGFFKNLNLGDTLNNALLNSIRPR
ncbi:hypothetical protein [Paraburkholderia sp. C35]|uniref:hypothetical protein n=1 Tax=Paraburkholderia sp. C35 TaxID=2126993 RepID=UPI000D68FF6B|nr:hypothetical protein [Paraburkholderia sp. C35]